MTFRSSVGAHPIRAFVVLAYAISWAAWVPPVLAARGVGPVPWSSHVPGLVGPMVAALVVTATSSGGTELRRVLRSCRRIPPVRWVLVATGPLALLGVAVVAAASFGGHVEWSDFGRFDGLPADVGPLGVLLLLVVVNGIGEETGWRGFLQPALQRRVPVRTATLTVAAVWGLWHTPLFFLDTGLGEMFPAMIPVWAVSLLAGAVALAWLHNHTASVLAAAIWHGTYNWATATAAAEDEAVIAVLVTAGVIATALVVVRRDPTLGAPEPAPPVR